ncbi:riboflavin kinase [Streptomyces olivaceiscleroticus]|uniref:riboflavin kinase n=1 Tax=Streptomyces olivaceiscleroticus TaxID=68245 RepID=A0ABP3JXH4_9ACTN
MQEAPDPLIVEGVVEAGDQRGRELGFPTANLSLAGDAIRGDAVWAGLVRLLDEPDSRPWVSAVSVGRRPTFYDRRGPRLLEAHLIDFRGDLYGRPIRVELCRRLRRMRAYGSVEALVHQLGDDVADARGWADAAGLEALQRGRVHVDR